MASDVRELLRIARAPGLRYRELRGWGRPAPGRPPAAPARGPLLVAIVSLAPRAGRTTVAASLAAAWARGGIAAAALDLGGGDLARQLGAPHLAGAPAGAAPEPAWVSRRLAVAAGDPALALDALAEGCGVVAVDTPAQVGPALQQAVAEADEVVVVVRPGPGAGEAVRGAQALLAHARGGAWRRSPARWIVNAFDGRRPGDREAYAALRRALGPRLLSPVVQEDAAVAAARAAGGTLYELAPDAQATADLDALAAQLAPAAPPRRGDA